ncbi:MAG: serine/threonine protein kinase [Deltaproteobacteria bacterium]|nr:serine/threonine protein kinase [Deltaproteobacteria bacterium]
MATLNTNPGTLIAGRYRIMSQIGAGGMGMVFRCHDITLDSVVAIKLLLPHLAADQSVFRRFRNEVLVARNLTHHNIVRIHDITQVEEGYYCLSMEFVDGVSLKDMIYGEPDSSLTARIDFTWEQALAALYQILCGVSYAHNKGVIHRDLKPANVLISNSGEVKIVDFGTARIVGSDTSLTMTGQIIGTPDYMSPEQIKGEALTSSCDIYALGLIAYELVTKRKPFIADSAVALAFKHLSEPIADARKINPRVPEWYQQMIEKAAAKEATQRYVSAKEMVTLISQYEPELVKRVNANSPDVLLMPVAAAQEINQHAEQDTGSSSSASFNGLQWEANQKGEKPFQGVETKKSSTSTDRWSWGSPDDVHELPELGRKKESSLGIWLLAFVILAAGGVFYWARYTNWQFLSQKEVGAPESLITSGSKGNQEEKSSVSSNRELDTKAIVPGKIIVENGEESSVNVREQIVPPKIRPAVELDKEKVQAVVPAIIPETAVSAAGESASEAVVASLSSESSASLFSQETSASSVASETISQSAAVEVQSPQSSSVLVSSISEVGARSFSSSSLETLFELHPETISALISFERSNRNLRGSQLSTKWSESVIISVKVSGFKEPLNEAIAAKITNSSGISLVNAQVMRPVKKLAFTSSRLLPTNEIEIEAVLAAADLRTLKPGEYSANLLVAGEMVSTKIFTVVEESEQVSSSVAAKPLREEVEESGAKERRVPWNLPSVERSAEREIIQPGSRETMPLLPGESSLPVQEPMANYETYSGQATISSEVTGGKSQRSITLNIQYGAAQIGGTANVSGIGQMGVKGGVYPRGFDMELTTSVVHIRLTGSKKDGVLRGRYLCNNPKETGTFEVSK